MASPTSRKAEMVGWMVLAVRSRQLNILYADIFPKLRCMVTLLSFSVELRAVRPQRGRPRNVTIQTLVSDPSRAANRAITPALNAVSRTLTAKRKGKRSRWLDPAPTAVGAIERKLGIGIPFCNGT